MLLNRTTWERRNSTVGPDTTIRMVFTRAAENLQLNDFFNKRPAKKSFFWKLITISKVKVCIIWEKKNQKFHLDQRLWLIIPLEKRGLEMTKDLIRLQNWIYGNTLNWKLKSHSVGFPRKDETKLKKKYIIRKVQKFLRNMTLG